MNKLTDEEMADLIATDPIKALCILVEEAGGTMKLYGQPVSESELKVFAADRAQQRFVSSALPGDKCNNLCPPDHEGHWREWHRGHGCNLDDGVAK